MPSANFRSTHPPTHPRLCQADADAALLGRQEVAAAAAQLLKVCLLPVAVLVWHVVHQQGVHKMLAAG